MPVSGTPGGQARPRGGQIREQRALDFIGLPAWEPEEREIFLKGDYERGMNPQTRRRPKGFYRPHNRRLYEYLGKDFGW